MKKFYLFVVAVFVAVFFASCLTIMAEDFRT
jgi:hypothetical protein